MITVIVNSDDFGYSHDINAAIVESFELGLISSATLMANMPGFEEAASHGRDHDQVRGRLGVHINLTEGVPLTEAMKRCRRFCNADGVMDYVRRKPIFFLRSDEKQAVQEEVRAQVEKLRLNGVQPTHMDSHQHIHTELAIAPICVRVCQEFGIRAVRLTRNVDTRDLLRKIYKKLLNRYLSSHRGLHATDFFCGAESFGQLMAQNALVEDACYEVMVHSRYDASGRLVDLDGQLLADRMTPVVQAFPPVSFGDCWRS